MQKTTLYSVTVPPMMKALQNLSGVLDKLSHHANKKQLEWHPKGMQEEALLSSRLISDQFPFLRQIQIACDNGAAGSSRLAGVEAPSFPDDEKTVEELKARIDKVVKYMKTIKEADVNKNESHEIELRYWPGKKMTGFGYATEYLMPNFYFHVATAYCILRKNGVELGKDDYIGEKPFIN